VKIFNWRLATEALAVQKSRWPRSMATNPTCTICGREDEDGYHMPRCHLKKLLRWDIIREVWDLPGEEDLRNNGKEWT
jgi:hypothetical protein